MNQTPAQQPPIDPESQLSQPQQDAAIPLQPRLNQDILPSASTCQPKSPSTIPFIFAPPDYEPPFVKDRSYLHRLFMSFFSSNFFIRVNPALRMGVYTFAFIAVVQQPDIRSKIPTLFLVMTMFILAFQTTFGRTLISIWYTTIALSTSAATVFLIRHFYVFDNVVSALFMAFSIPTVLILWGSSADPTQLKIFCGFHPMYIILVWLRSGDIHYMVNLYLVSIAGFAGSLMISLVPWPLSASRTLAILCYRLISKCSKMLYLITRAFLSDSRHVSSLSSPFSDNLVKDPQQQSQHQRSSFINQILSSIKKNRDAVFLSLQTKDVINSRTTTTTNTTTANSNTNINHTNTHSTSPLHFHTAPTHQHTFQNPSQLYSHTTLPSHSNPTLNATATTPDIFSPRAPKLNLKSQRRHQKRNLNIDSIYRESDSDNENAPNPRSHHLNPLLAPNQHPSQLSATPQLLNNHASLTNTSKSTPQLHQPLSPSASPTFEQPLTLLIEQPLVSYNAFLPIPSGTIPEATEDELISLAGSYENGISDAMSEDDITATQTDTTSTDSDDPTGSNGILNEELEDKKDNDDQLKNEEGNEVGEQAESHPQPTRGSKIHRNKALNLLNNRNIVQNVADLHACQESDELDTSTRQPPKVIASELRTPPNELLTPPQPNINERFAHESTYLSDATPRSNYDLSYNDNSHSTKSAPYNAQKRENEKQGYHPFNDHVCSPFHQLSALNDDLGTHTLLPQLYLAECTSLLDSMQKDINQAQALIPDLTVESQIFRIFYTIFCCCFRSYWTNLKHAQILAEEQHNLFNSKPPDHLYPLIGQHKATFMVPYNAESVPIFLSEVSAILANIRGMIRTLSNMTTLSPAGIVFKYMHTLYLEKDMKRVARSVKSFVFSSTQRNPDLVPFDMAFLDALVKLQPPTTPHSSQSQATIHKAPNCVDQTYARGMESYHRRRAEYKVQKQRFFEQQQQQEEQQQQTSNCPETPIPPLLPKPIKPKRPIPLLPRYGDPSNAFVDVFAAIYNSLRTIHPNDYINTRQPLSKGISLPQRKIAQHSKKQQKTHTRNKRDRVSSCSGELQSSTQLPTPCAAHRPDFQSNGNTSSGSWTEKQIRSLSFVPATYTHTSHSIRNMWVLYSKLRRIAVMGQTYTIKTPLPQTPTQTRANHSPQRKHSNNQHKPDQPSAQPNNGATQSQRQTHYLHIPPIFAYNGHTQLSNLHNPAFSSLPDSCNLNKSVFTQIDSTLTSPVPETKSCDHSTIASNTSTLFSHSTTRPTHPHDNSQPHSPIKVFSTPQFHINLEDLLAISSFFNNYDRFLHRLLHRIIPQSVSPHLWPLLGLESTLPPALALPDDSNHHILFQTMPRQTQLRQSQSLSHPETRTEMKMPRDECLAEGVTQPNFAPCSQSNVDADNIDQPPSQSDRNHNSNKTNRPEPRIFEEPSLTSSSRPSLLTLDTISLNTEPLQPPHDSTQTSFAHSSAPSVQNFPPTPSNTINRSPTHSHSHNETHHQPAIVLTYDHQFDIAQDDCTTPETPNPLPATIHETPTVPEQFPLQTSHLVGRPSFAAPIPLHHSLSPRHPPIRLYSLETTPPSTFKRPSFFPCDRFVFIFVPTAVIWAWSLLSAIFHTTAAYQCSFRCCGCGCSPYRRRKIRAPSQNHPKHAQNVSIELQSTVSAETRGEPARMQSNHGATSLSAADHSYDETDQGTNEFRTEQYKPSLTLLEVLSNHIKPTPKDIANYQRAIKCTVCVVLPALVVFIPNKYRDSFLYIHWAVLTAGLLMAESLAQSVAGVVNRIQGTVVGAIFGYVVTLISGQLDPELRTNGSILFGAAALAFWNLFLAYYRSASRSNFAASTVTMFTASTILLGSGGVEPINVAINRIHMSFYGCLSVVVVSYLLWPRQALAVLLDGYVAALSQLRECTELNFTLLKLTTANSESYSVFGPTLFPALVAHKSKFKITTALNTSQIDLVDPSNTFSPPHNSATDPPALVSPLSTHLIDNHPNNVNNVNNVISSVHEKSSYYLHNPFSPHSELRTLFTKYFPGQPIQGLTPRDFMHVYNTRMQAKSAAIRTMLHRLSTLSLDIRTELATSGRDGSLFRAVSDVIHAQSDLNRTLARLQECLQLNTMLLLKLPRATHVLQNTHTSDPNHTALHHSHPHFDTTPPHALTSNTHVHQVHNAKKQINWQSPTTGASVFQQYGAKICELLTALMNDLTMQIEDIKIDTFCGIPFTFRSWDVQILYNTDVYSFIYQQQSKSEQDHYQHVLQRQRELKVQELIISANNCSHSGAPPDLASAVPQRSTQSAMNTLPGDFTMRAETIHSTSKQYLPSHRYTPRTSPQYKRSLQTILSVIKQFQRYNRVPSERKRAEFAKGAKLMQFRSIPSQPPQSKQLNLNLARGWYVSIWGTTFGPLFVSQQTELDDIALAGSSEHLKPANSQAAGTDELIPATPIQMTIEPQSAHHSTSTTTESGLERAQLTPVLSDPDEQTLAHLDIMTSLQRAKESITFFTNTSYHDLTKQHEKARIRQLFSMMTEIIMIYEDGYKFRLEMSTTGDAAIYPTLFLHNEQAFMHNLASLPNILLSLLVGINMLRHDSVTEH